VSPHKPFVVHTQHPSSCNIPNLTDVPLSCNIFIFLPEGVKVNNDTSDVQEQYFSTGGPQIVVIVINNVYFYHNGNNVFQLSTFFGIRLLLSAE
jgi:hypothetical protein